MRWRLAFGINNMCVNILQRFMRVKKGDSRSTPPQKKIPATTCQRAKPQKPHPHYVIRKDRHNNCKYLHYPHYPSTKCILAMLFTQYTDERMKICDRQRWRSMRVCLVGLVYLPRFGINSVRDDNRAWIILLFVTIRGMGRFIAP